jgi:hypothetical protein
MPSAIDAYPLQIWPTNGRINQRWRKVRHSSGLYLLESLAKPGHVIDVQGGFTTRGQVLWLYKRNDTAAQLWDMKDVDASYAGRKMFASALGHSLVMDVRDGKNSTQGNPVQTWDSNDTIAQRWEVLEGGDDTFVIVNSEYGLALDVSGL